MDRRPSQWTDEHSAVVGRNVRRLRTERQLSLGALAEQAGLAKQTLANLESGQGNPTIETFMATARALGVGATWLLTEWGSPVIVHRSGDAEWEGTPGARRRRLDDIFGTGQVLSSVISLRGPATTAPPLSTGTLMHVLGASTGSATVHLITTVPRVQQFSTR